MIEIIIIGNKDEKIEYTKDELEKLLKRVYDDGYRDGCASKVYTALPYKETYSGISITATNQGVTPCTLQG